MKQDLELLYELQNYDLKIDEIKKKISQTPYLIKEKMRALEDKKTEVSVQKQSFIELNCLKKEKEAVLDSKDKAISKRSMELNTVKANDIYKILLLEIERAKADKNAIEDEILDLMDKIDGESIVVKSGDTELKEFEQKIKNEMNDLEEYAKKLKEEIISIVKEREIQKLKINKAVLVNYERLREGRDGREISLIDGTSCEVCGMVLRPQLINMAQKYQELVFCDNCSRILFKK
ncbi:MAG: C4-type zinc ribbon domain-containing protein [Endomicrobium sp.]|nr:C4-type zinc ribbon domain-containing protein [Endomicrobium sp.]